MSLRNTVQTQSSHFWLKKIAKSLRIVIYADDTLMCWRKKVEAAENEMFRFSLLMGGENGMKKNIFSPVTNPKKLAMTLF